MRIGERFDRYVILDEAGFPRAVPVRTRTFQALDLATLDEVALTVPSPKPSGREDFVAEAEEARRLDSPDLAPLLRAAENGGQPFVASAWLPGIDLDEALQDGPFDHETGLFVLGSLISALASLHSRGLVHGNVHPAHLRIGPDGRVRLVGYVPAPFGAPETTRPPEAKVSRYAPPEWYAARTLSPAADVYSTALVGYQLFSGRPLLPAANLRRNQDGQQLLQRTLDRIERVARSIPPTLGPLFHAMLQLDRARRPRNGFVLLAGLVKASPHWVPDGPPPPALLERLAAGAGKVRLRRLEAAGQAAAAGAFLAVAARLRSMVEMGGKPSPAERPQAEALLRKCLWTSWIQGPLPEAREALLLQIARAAVALDSPGLAFLARARLDQVARPGGRAAEAGFPPTSMASLEAQRPAFVAWVAGRPADEDALLPLAILATGLAVPAGTSIDGIKAALCRKLKLFAAALYHRARDLQSNPTDPFLLVELSELSGLAAGEPAPARDPSYPTSPPPSDPSAILEAELTSWVGPVSRPDDDRETVSVLEEASRPPGPEIASHPVPRPEEPEPISLLGARIRGATQLAAERRFAAGQLKVAEGKPEEAIREFAALLRSGPEVREGFHAALCCEVRRLAWRALPSGGTPAGLGLLSGLRELARTLRMATLARVLERMLVDALPEAERGVRLDELAAQHPDSVEIQRRAALESARIGDDVLRYRHLVALGFLLADLGSVAEASRCFLAARALTEESRLAVAGMNRVFEQGARLAAAAEEFKELDSRLAGSAHPEDGLARCEEFLDRYPGYGPGLERAVDLAVRSGDSRRAARFSSELAAKALAEDRPQRARELLREVLRAEPDHDEAMLVIAAIEPLAGPQPTDPTRIKIGLLAREGLFPAAIHHARRLPVHGPTGDATHALLIDLARRADQDVSPFLLARGHWALTQGDPREARRCFEEAIEASPQRNATLDSLLRTPGIDAVFPRLELARLRS